MVPPPQVRLQNQVRIDPNIPRARIPSENATLDIFGRPESLWGASFLSTPYNCPSLIDLENDHLSRACSMNCLDDRRCEGAARPELDIGSPSARSSSIMSSISLDRVLHGPHVDDANVLLFRLPQDQGGMGPFSIWNCQSSSSSRIISFL